MIGGMSTQAERVVVGLDGSEESGVGLGWAIDAALRWSAPLHLVHVLVPPTVEVPPTTRQWEMMRSAGERILAEARDRAERAGVRGVETETATDDAARALVELSDSASALVLGARGHGVAYGMWVGSVSQSVTRCSRCPTVVVRAPTDPTQTRIVVGVDGSPNGAAALRWALAEADRRGVPLTAIHGWHDHDAATFGTQSPVWSATADRIEAGERLVRSVLDEHARDHPSVKVLVESIPVHPARLLSDASQHAALVVLGARGRGGTDVPLLGSVAQSVLHHSGCPVVVVPGPRPPHSVG